MRIGKLKIIAIPLALVFTVVLPIYAYMYVTSQQIPTGITIKTPTLQIGIYEGGEPLTVIDFGTIPQPNWNATMSTGQIQLVNEGDVPLTVYWNSTLNSITDEITEEWVDWSFGIPWNGTVVASGSTKYIRYTIFIPQYVTIATYNWTLTVWGVY